MYNSINFSLFESCVRFANGVWTKQSLFFLKARLPRLTAEGGQARNDKKREIATASLREASHLLKT
jgi:hypothetical protein